MPCSPIADSDIITPPVPSGFGGLPTPQLPRFDLGNPLPVEDLLGLFDQLSIVLPSGTLKPNLSAQFSKDILDGILSLLEKFMPFLMMYSFFMPILNMILCIIEVLCAIANPFKLVRALKRLFRVCIPEFLALFPFFALILMIIALLLLILALILYLIQRIIEMIRQILANIKMLAEAVASVDNDSVIAITVKLGDLLCIFQNLFVLFGVIVLILQIIERLLNLSFQLPPCDEDSGSECCGPDVCPSFLRNNEEISSSTGTLQYFNNVIQTGGILGPAYIRTTGFQFYDPAAPQTLQFNNITHAYDLPPGFSQVFFPEGETYTPNTTPNMVPYLVDIRFFYDPAVFGRTDNKGARFIRVKDCIVLKAPVDGVSDYQNNLVAPFNGTLSIGGGTAFEDNGITIMKVNSTDDAAGKLETIIFLPDNASPTPIVTPNDGLKFENVTYTFKITHEILVGKSLITLGCVPSLALSKNAINLTIGQRFNDTSAAFSNIILPDVQAAQDCVINAVNQFRNSISVETAEQLQTTVVECLTNLQNQTNQTLEDVINAGFDPYKSTFILDPTIQFTTKPINIEVQLNEAGGNNIAANIPVSVAANLASNLAAIVTLGVVGDFTYDGSSKFIAQITSNGSGNGTAKVAYQGQLFSILTNPEDLDLTPSVSTRELSYTFVQSSAIAIGGEPGAVRRDEGDVSRDSSERDGG